jgi:hypothetical protein
LQDYDEAAIEEHILWSYPQLMNRLLDSLEELPAGDVTTVRYEELVADPLGAIERIYRELHIGDFPRARTSIEAAIAAPFHRPTASYGIDDAALSSLASRWSLVLDRLGYPMPTGG